ncbi:MAG: nitrate reductase maturation protein NarM [Cyanobacteria bacterium RM1_2_2]|nr:nitrate reductase maturation protein NarM [Cyanobacteria bacterium RM1_2_2]
MADFFQFEADFVDTLRCIPMQVRYKLDTCGIKLKLPHWNQFNVSERQQLVEMPCTTAAEIQAYRSRLQQMVQVHTGELPADLLVESHPWLEAKAIPESVQTQAESVGCSISLTEWANLSPLQRFALIKLSRSQHENKNFLPALQEFGLA